MTDLFDPSFALQAAYFAYFQQFYQNFQNVKNAAHTAAPVGYHQTEGQATHPWTAADAAQAALQLPAVPQPQPAVELTAHSAAATPVAPAAAPAASTTPFAFAGAPAVATGPAVVPQVPSVPSLIPVSAVAQLPQAGTASQLPVQLSSEPAVALPAQQGAAAACMEQAASTTAPLATQPMLTAAGELCVGAPAATAAAADADAAAGASAAAATPAVALAEGQAGEAMQEAPAAAAPPARMALPSLHNPEDTIYVNAKQYECILRRRQQRKKLQPYCRVVRTRKVSRCLAPGQLCNVACLRIAGHHVHCMPQIPYCRTYTV